MGFFDAGMARARRMQRQALLKEAVGAGCTVHSLAGFGPGPPDGGPTGARLEADGEREAEGVTGRAVKSVMGALFGDRAQMDALDVMELESLGRRHLYFQPHSGLNPLPGEHHAILSGDAPVSVAYVRRGRLGRKRWHASDAATAAALNSHDGLGRVVRRCKWKWDLGLSAVRLDWTVQARRIGGRLVHLVLASGRYGGFHTHRVGFAQFMAVREVMIDVLGSLVPATPGEEGRALSSGETHDAPEHFLHPATYEAPALTMLLGHGP